VDVTMEKFCLDRVVKMNFGSFFLRMEVDVMSVVVDIGNYGEEYFE